MGLLEVLTLVVLCGLLWLAAWMGKEIVAELLHGRDGKGGPVKWW